MVQNAFKLDVCAFLRTVSLSFYRHSQVDQTASKVVHSVFFVCSTAAFNRVDYVVSNDCLDGKN
jgi:hypothetical protein